MSIRRYKRGELETEIAPIFIRNNDDYKSDVQKIVSYKGVIRPITVSATNKRGGKYKLRIINIYVKPNEPKTEALLEDRLDKNGNIVYNKDGKPARKFVYEHGRPKRVPLLDTEGKPVLKENTRFYEKQSYEVDKKAITNGTSSDNYYPSKALWSELKKTIKGEKEEDKEYTPTHNEYSRRKAKQIALKRLRSKKTQKKVNKARCKCIKKR